MSCRFFIICLLGLVISPGAFSQQGHKYRTYSRDVCISSERNYSRMPAQVYMDVILEEGTFYLITNNEKWVDDFFKDSRLLNVVPDNLSLGVKLVSTEYFSCDNSSYKNPENYFYNLPPVSYNMLQNRKETLENGLTVFPLGDVPSIFADIEFDHGIIISKRDRPCINHWYIQYPVHDWRLLEHALLLDTLVYFSDSVNIPVADEPVILELKHSFDVVFAKDKVLFSHDSVIKMMTAIEIPEGFSVDVDLKAFASVEGTSQRNAELYNQRGRLIWDVIKPFLPSQAHISMSVSENWDEFYADIENGSYAWMAGLSHDEIRERLKEPVISSELEPILKNHRKTTVNIYAARQVEPLSSDPYELLDFYHQTIRLGNDVKALQLQDAIFARLLDEKTDFIFPKSFPLPGSKRMNIVFNREISLRYFKGNLKRKETYALFKEILKIYPEDPRIHFNLAELELRQWILGDSIDPKKLLARISNLASLGVPAEVQKRLLINYHMVNMRFSHAEANDAARNRSIRAIKNLYVTTQTREHELAYIARFFAAYKQIDFAERMLRRYAYSENPDPDLLYYYINLTINATKYNRTRGYNKLLVKALELDNERFCGLFQPLGYSGTIGISLLFNNDLKEMYCRHCYE
jgi:hypothetical protein